MACRPSRRWSPGATGRPRRTRSRTSTTVGGSRGRSACAATSPPASASSSTRGAASISWRPARKSRDVAALYALSEGEYVSYILGAPAFVTQPFRHLFADGLPLMTPLVARSEGPP